MSNIRLFFSDTLSANMIDKLDISSLSIILADKVSEKNNLILLICVKLIYEKY